MLAVVDRSSFNSQLIENEIPAIGQGEMLFLDMDGFYYASPVKFTDLSAYHDVLLAAEVEVSRFDKNELASDKITFARVDNSLIYRVELVTN